MNSEPTTAEPTVAPTWRKKLLEAVAVPTIRLGTEFCTISTRICMLSPMPAPNTARNTHIRTVESETSRVDSSHRPMPMISMPTRGNSLYRPVRETIWPETIEVISREAIMGVMSRPAWVASTPLTIWM